MNFSKVHLDEAAVNFLGRVRKVLDETLGDAKDWPVLERGSGSRLHEALGAEGLIAPSWPVEEGGAGFGALGERLVSEELARRQVYISRTPVMVAATIRKYLEDGQLRAEVLAGIANGTTRIALGYSEPDGGSDIANARTRAVPEGDDWLINGSKVFTSAAHDSKYVFLLTRTNVDVPKHRGLTMFLVPLDSPGIELQPLITISRERTNITFYRDVRVSDRYRLGPVDAGWSVLQDPLNTEHGIDAGAGNDLADVHGQGVLSTTPASVLVGRFLRWSVTPDRSGAVPLDRPEVMVALADAMVDLEVARNTPGAMGKVAASQAFPRIASKLIDVVGVEGLIEQGEPSALEDGVFDWAHRRAQITSIVGGTVEVFKNLLAVSELHLPRQLPASPSGQRTAPG